MIPQFLAPFKVEAVVVTSCIFIGTTVSALALSEDLTGQLIVALIGALPPTAAVIVTLISLKRGQKEMTIALDGKLEKLMLAEKGVSKAEGIAEERAGSYERTAQESPAKTAAIVAATVAAVKSDPDTVSKIEVVNTEENRVPVAFPQDEKLK